MAGFFFVWLVFGLIIGGGVGYVIGNNKGRGAEGFWLGALLGFIGWIVVALMEPSTEFRAERDAALAATVRGAVATADPRANEPTRVCPWCAETIKAAAKVCRFCARDVDPVEVSIAETTAQELDTVRAEYPEEFEVARGYLAALQSAPLFPARWLAELCKRMRAGSPADAAAARIPLDWSGLPPEPARPMPTPSSLGDPEAAGSFEAIARDHPQSYDRGRAVLAGLSQPPHNPEAWLRELCTRIDAGSPPEAAAARIPLDVA